MVQCKLLLIRVQPIANPNRAFQVKPTANPNRAYPVQPTANPNRGYPVQPTANPNRAYPVQPTANPNPAFPVQPTANPNRAFQVQSKSIMTDQINLVPLIGDRLNIHFDNFNMQLHNNDIIMRLYTSTAYPNHYTDQELAIYSPMVLVIP